MKARSRIFSILLCLFSICSSAHMNQFSYQRELKGIEHQWHRIILPDEIFRRLNPVMSDIRIYGITSGKDTVEAPYFIRSLSGSDSVYNVNFRLLNSSAFNENGYYFTFEVPVLNPVNQINLKFKQQNFDWRIELEGSQDQQELFTVLKDYRIMSIHNAITDFQFTQLLFPDSKYRYLRLSINAKEKPELTEAGIIRKTVAARTLKSFPLISINRAENKELNSTEIGIELLKPVPVSIIAIQVNEEFDYYRPLTIEYLADSFETEKGWQYNYVHLYSGTLNSVNLQPFEFPGTILKKLRIRIENHQNQVLKIDSILVQGFVHELIARFTVPGSYFLTYGNKKIAGPAYDIERFRDNIPVNLTTLNLGNEIVLAKRYSGTGKPFFQNNGWLWALLIVIIWLLGWFTFSMIRKRQHSE